MARHLSTLCALAVLVCFAGFPANAGPLKSDMLPKSATWVIHVDYEALADSAIAERVRSKRPELVERIRTWFEEQCGTNPRKDIESITIFSDNYQPHTGALVICGEFDEDKVESLLKKKRDVKQTEHEGHTFYTWKLPHGHEGFQGEHITGDEAPVSPKPGHERQVTDASADSSAGAADQSVQRDDSVSSQDHPAHEVTAVLIEGKTAVLAGSEERAREVVRLLNGDEPTLKDDSKLLKGMPDDALVYGAAIDLKEISQHERPFPILSQHKRVQWVFGERDEEMFETFLLVADRSKTAREMEKAMQGLVALAKLWADDLDTLASLYDDTEIERDGLTVAVEWQGSVDDVMTALDELRPRFQAWKEYHQKMRR